MFEQLKEEIEELKGCHEELKGELEKEIQQNKEKEVIKIKSTSYSILKLSFSCLYFSLMFFSPSGNARSGNQTTVCHCH